MASSSVRQKIDNLSARQKEQISQLARNGRKIGEIAKRHKLEYGLVQTVLWQQGTLPWQGAKKIITSRLRSLRRATRQEHRVELANDIQEQVDYLYYAARQLQATREKAKKTLA